MCHLRKYRRTNIKNALILNSQERTMNNNTTNTRRLRRTNIFKDNNMEERCGR